MTKEYYNLELLRIHELRDLARKMGVKSPTTMKRDDLIKEINKIMQGEAKPYIKANKQGRPARNQSNFAVNDLFVPSYDDFMDEELRPYNTSSNSEYTWEVAMPQAVYTAVTDDNLDECEGFVDINSKGYGMLRNKDFVPRVSDKYISPIIIKKYSLKSGDLIKGNSKFVSADKPEVLVEVLSEEIDRKFDFEKERVILGRFIEDLPHIQKINLGGRYQVVAKNRIEKNEIIKDLLSELTKDKTIDVKTFILNAGNLTESYKNVETKTIPFNVRDDESIKATELYFEYCKRQVEESKDIVVVVDSLSQLAKNYNSVITNDVMHNTIHPQTLHKIKEILGMAKSLSTGSLTIINVDAFVVPQTIKSLFEYEINPLFN